MRQYSTDMGSNRFPTTRISLVLAAGGSPTSESREALASLCGIYWYPLYAYIRRQGHSADVAQDLTQGFFTRILEKNPFRTFEQERGRFRSFLLGALKHFLTDERDWATRLKRGGGIAEAGESRYSLEPQDDRTPEKLFEKQWALTLLDRVFARLQDEFASAGKSRHFERFKGFLNGEAPGVSYKQAAAELGMTEGAVKVAVHRLRGRFHEIMREEIAETVADPAEISEEIRYLLAAIRA